jgi:hypothetical protein
MLMNVLGFLQDMIDVYSTTNLKGKFTTSTMGFTVWRRPRGRVRKQLIRISAKANTSYPNHSPYGSSSRATGWDLSVEITTKKSAFCPASTLSWSMMYSNEATVGSRYKNISHPRKVFL